MKIVRKFFCTKCGLCCRAINETYDRGDGYCKYLTPENTCSIYDTRPDFCKVDKIYEMFYKNKMSEEEYYKKSREACIKLKHEG